MVRWFVTAVLLMAGSSVAHASLISTTAEWDGQSEVGTFGEGSTDSYGQTFVTPSGETVLQSFSIYIDDRLTPDFVDFAAYVMEWADSDGIQQAAHAVGPILYESAPLATSNNGGQDGFESFTFLTGGLNLDPGKKYAFFVSSSLFWDGIHGGGKVGVIYENVYTEGEFVYQSTGKDFQVITNGGGWNFDPSRDLVFSGEFSPVPISPAAWLFGSALGSLVWLRRNVASKPRGVQQ